MAFGARILASVAALGVLFAAAAVYYYKSRDIKVNEDMHFCELQYNDFTSFQKLINYVDSAKERIDVCMPPGLYNPEIHARLLNAILIKKVKLRLLVDGDEDCSFTFDLFNAGADIKIWVNHRQPNYCIIDGTVVNEFTDMWNSHNVPPSANNSVQSLSMTDDDEYYSFIESDQTYEPFDSLDV